MMQDVNDGIGQMSVVGENVIGTVPGNTGGILQQQAEQYIANKDKYNVWRVLDQWHSSLTHLSPTDEIPDDGDAVLMLTEGQFIALMKAAIQTGTYPQLNQATGELELEDVHQLAEQAMEITMLKTEAVRLEDKVFELEDALKQSYAVTEAAPEVMVTPTPPVSEEASKTSDAMEYIFKLATHKETVDSIKDLAN